MDKEPDLQAASQQPSGNQSLVSHIAACGDALTRKVAADMYRDPFWDARFGARGRRHTEEDGRFHLSYLTQALLAGSDGDVGVLTNYAVWLRSVLVSRGMCSRHLAENFERLAAALHEEELAFGTRAVDFLKQAAAALRYEQGPAAQLQQQLPDLVDRAVRTIRERHADWRSPSTEQSLEAWCRTELQYYLSYLADALATGRPELFSKHMQWSAAFVARLGSALPTENGASAPDVPTLLSELEAAVESLGDPALSAQTRPIVGAARDALRASAAHEDGPR